MYGKLSRYAYNLCKNSNGLVQGTPRIINESKADLPIVGYAEVNTMATTAFTRTKVHKGYFYCSASEVYNGDVIRDRDDNAKYFVMSVKSERGASNETVYMDGTLYKVDSRLSVSRFDEAGTRDSFGRVVASGAVLVTQDTTKVKTDQDDGTTVYGMTIPKNFDVLTQQDREIPQNKISLCLQAGVNLKIADRITDLDTGETYRVSSIDYKSISGLLLVYVDEDVR